jgi:hypothetical protein
VPAARSEVGEGEVLQLAQAFDLAPQLGFCPRIEHVEGEAALVAQGRAGAQLVDDGQGWDLPHGGVGPGTLEVQLVLTVPLRKFVFGEPEITQPGDEGRGEHLGLAIEAVARQPDQLLVGEGEGARMVELGPQFSLVDDLGEADLAAPVYQREGRLDVGMQRLDELQHQQLVEIRVQQAADDGIQPPAVIVGAGRNVGQGHGATTARPAVDCSGGVRLSGVVWAARQIAHGQLAVG